jgi:hypothetical protein
MTSRNTQHKTAFASQNDGIKVTEYNPIYADHEDHGRLLSLIDGVWLLETDWRTLAEEKLNIDRDTFHSMKAELEQSGCVAQVGERCAAIQVRYPVAHFTKPWNFIIIQRPN